MRRVNIERPFVSGLMTDEPAWKIPKTAGTIVQDAMVTSGVISIRRGWQYADAKTSTIALGHHGVARVAFALAGQIITITTGEHASFGPSVAVHDSTLISPTTVFGTAIPGSRYSPRCVYRDELIICAGDGVSSLLRYSGATFLDGTNRPTSTQLNAGKATLTATAGSFGASVRPGCFSSVNGDADLPPVVYPRVVEATSASVTLEDARSSSTGGSGFPSPVGYSYPCVPIYSAGTITLASPLATGTGTKWASPPASLKSGDSGDSVLVKVNSGLYRNHWVQAPDTDTSLFCPNSSDATDQPYEALRRCPFTDAETHKDALWGTGVAQYPNRVYTFPPGWNPAYPPGATLPFDQAIPHTSSNPEVFKAFQVDVPSPFDGDPNIAVVSADGPILVLKRKSVWAIDGSYPNFSVRKVADGRGCLHRNLATRTSLGPTWAGDEGIFVYRNGQVVDLTAGKINREWRALTGANPITSTSRVWLSEAEGHILIGVGTPARCYNIAEQSWSYVTNVDGAHAWSEPVGSETPKSLLVGGATTPTSTQRVLDLAPMFRQTTTPALGLDGGSAAPSMILQTGLISEAGGIEGQSRMVDVEFHSRLDSANVIPSVFHQQALRDTVAATTLTLPTMTPFAAVQTGRYKNRVGRTGRKWTFRFTSSGVSAATSQITIDQIVATFRDVRSRA